MIISETDIFAKAIRQGYVYFKDWHGEIHKGFVFEYSANICWTDRASLTVIYGITYCFDWRDDLYVKDDEEIIRDPTKHELYDQCDTYLFITFEGLCLENYMTRWALNKEDLL